MRLLALASAVVVPYVQASPSDVVKAFYKACTDALYSKAETFATKQSLEFLKTNFAMGGGMKGFCEDVTEEGTLEQLEIVSEKVRGEGATVAFRFHYKGGKVEDGKESLILTGGIWKIDVLGQGARDE